MYKKRQSHIIKHFDFILFDILCLVTAFVLGYIIRHGVGAIWSHRIIYGKLLLIYITLNLLVVFARNGYSDIVRRGYFQEAKQTFLHCVIVDGLLLLYMFLLKETEIYSRESLLICYVIWYFLAYIVRCLWKKIIRHRVRRKEIKEQMVLFTDFIHWKQCLHELLKESYNDYCVVAVVFVDNFESLHNSEFENDIVFKEAAAALDKTGISFIKSIGQFSRFLLENVVDSVFIDANLDEKELSKTKEELIDAGVTVHTKIFHSEQHITNYEVEYIGNYIVITEGMHIITVWQAAMKRCIDIIGGIVGTVLTLLLAVVLSPFIFIQSPGPIFFRQKRVGKNGRAFTMYKFRSMYMDAEERKKELLNENKINGLMFKMENDPRVMPVGRFIRKHSLDEFPQFFNVLKGEMSLVGTRPPTMDEVEKYELHHRGRLNVKPGITGLWQTSGRNEIIDFEEVVELDKKYIANWSIVEDIRIMLQTLVQMVQGKDAY